MTTRAEQAVTIRKQAERIHALTRHIEAQEVDRLNSEAILRNALRAALDQLHEEHTANQRLAAQLRIERTHRERRAS